MEQLVGSEERRSWEAERDRLLARIKELQAEKEQSQQQVNGARSKEKLRSSAESQVTFNEAIRKVIEEKDKRIESLESSLKSRMADRASVAASQRSVCLTIILHNANFYPVKSPATKV